LYLLICIIMSGSSTAQTTTVGARRDPQAVSLLSQLLQHGGTTVDTVQDFVGTGTITYYFGTVVQGTATIRGRGISQFRVDSALPGGQLSWAISNGAGWCSSLDGTLRSIPYHNTIPLQSLTFPLRKLSTAIAEPTTEITFKGLQAVGAATFYIVRTIRHPLTSNDTTTQGLETADYLIDPVTLTLSSIHTNTHPVNTLDVDIPVVVNFSDYRTINGLLAPFAVAEYVDGQQIWSLQVGQIQFNTGLTDLDFQF
jgi:hypothetical protein